MSRPHHNGRHRSWRQRILRRRRFSVLTLVTTGISVVVFGVAGTVFAANVVGGPRPGTKPSAAGPQPNPARNGGQNPGQTPVRTQQQAVQGAAAAAAANPNPNCTLIVPANPLSAQGLATPYRLTATNPAMGPCREANPNQGAFVQGAVLDPATGKVSLYNPLVVDRGTAPLAAPVVPKLPAGAVVGLWFGFNGTNLTLKGTGNSLAQGRCVNGTGASVFGQFAYCNAPAFFQAANKAVAAGQLTVPPLGTATDGMPCMSTRDFGLIDQDQSDNVTTSYLSVGARTAQNTTANATRFKAQNPLTNASDNLLLDQFVDKALGCTPMTAPDLANGGAPATSLPLNELQAAAHQGAPVALVPLNDPMTTVNAARSATKTNLYRAGVDQPPVSNAAGGNPTTYCRNMVTVQQKRLRLDTRLTMKVTSPAPAMASNLFTFLAMRLNQSFTNLGCMGLLKMKNPVTLTTNGAGVVVAAAFAGRPRG